VKNKALRIPLGKKASRKALHLKKKEVKIGRTGTVWSYLWAVRTSCGNT